MNEIKTSTVIGADVGGTFTDVIFLDSRGAVWSHKVPSTSPDFENAVLKAIEHLLAETRTELTSVKEVAHGTTVATNAVLEHRGARTALITTRGFRDVLELRRIRAPQLYDLFFEKPAPLVERFCRFELGERISATGEVLETPSPIELESIARRLESEGIESVAVCFLHSYAFPEHEQFVGQFLSKRLPSLEISLSCDVLRERREYERSATTVVNAYVRPVMQRYLRAMRSGLQELKINAPLLIMQSAGGLTPEEDAAKRPVYVLESGPAAGVLAAGFTARQLGIENVVTFDMGGTTAKASLIAGGSRSYSPEYEVGASLSGGNRLVGGGGELIRAPTVDIAEVGAGGGSIAALDRAGGLRVGPRSAGALPGPVCYQRGGEEPTLTDANVVLGYIRPGPLADGQVSIDPDAARRAVADKIAGPLGMDLLEAAEGIHRIANARTMRALREVSTQRGLDPRDFVLIAFGGAGPIHAARLSVELHTRQVIVPPLPGLFSALGLLFSGIEHHAARSCRLSGTALTADAVQLLVDEMHSELLGQFQREGFSADQISFSRSVDVRFRGQTSEIGVPLQDGSVGDATLQTMYTAFEDEHERLYGHRSDPDNPIEVVAVRSIGCAGTSGETRVIRAAERLKDGVRNRKAYFGSKWGELNTPVVVRGELKQSAEGPLLIDEYDSTIVIPPDMSARCDEFDNIVMQTKATS